MQPVKVLLFFVSLFELSYSASLLKGVTSEPLETEIKSQALAPSMQCFYGPYYLPSFVMEMYRKITTKMATGTQKKFTIRNFPGTSKYKLEVAVLFHCNNKNEMMYILLRNADFSTFYLLSVAVLFRERKSQLLIA